MAPNACKVLSLIIFFAFITQGYGYCDLTYLTVKQTKTGRMVQGKPEWEVRVINPCRCRFEEVKLHCVGFQSVTPMPYYILSKSGDLCLINNSKPIYSHIDFVFNYVWDTEFDLTVIDGVLICPPPGPPDAASAPSTL